MPTPFMTKSWNGEIAIHLDGDGKAECYPAQDIHAGLGCLHFLHIDNAAGICQGISKEGDPDPKTISACAECGIASRGPARR